MSEAFGTAYADAYDALYADKDYDAECDLLEKVFAASGRPVRTVLDLGCGTGAHSSRLAARGYEVVGVDISDAMLDIARRHEDTASGRVDYVQGDIRSVRLGRQFDAVICMFAVLGYQISDADVTQTLGSVRHHLAPSGSFTFDVWYGPAVESIRPSTRRRLVTTGDSEVERRASAELDPDAHVCAVSYQLIKRPQGGSREIAEEVHRMRYFFADELERFTSEAGLTLIDLMPFPDTTARLSRLSWNVIGIARG